MGSKDLSTGKGRMSTGGIKLTRNNADTVPYDMAWHDLYPHPTPWGSVGVTPYPLLTFGEI